MADQKISQLTSTALITGDELLAIVQPVSDPKGNKKVTINSLLGFFQDQGALFAGDNISELTNDAGFITNNAINNEIPVSDGANLIGSKIYTATEGALAFGDGASGIDVQISVNSSAPNAQIQLLAKSAGAVVMGSSFGIYLGTSAYSGTTRYIEALGSETDISVLVVPKGAGDVALGNFVFDADQTVGAGQDNYVLTYDNTSGLISLEAVAGGGGALSALTAATGANTINNLGHAQEWQWNSLGGATGLKLSSTSTAAASNLQTLFEVNKSGANATSSQTSYAAKFIHTGTGTGANNVGVYASASGGANNYAGIFENGFVGIGTTTPGSFLEIKTNGTNYALNILNSSGTTSLAKFDKFGKLGLGSIDPTYNLDIQSGSVAARLNSTSGTSSASFFFSGASVVKGTITAYSSAHATKPNEFDINATNQLNLISGGLIHVSPTSGVLVGGTTITASAILDLQSTTKAFVPPRVTTAQKNAISSPSAGMFVYDTDFSAYSYHNGSSWRVLGVDGGLFYSNKVFSSTSWGGGNNSIYSSSELGTISNNTTFQVELIIELIQDSATVGSSGISARIVASFRKNNSGTVVQIGSTTVIFEHNDTGDSILTNTLSYSTNIMWDFTMSGTKTHTVKTYTKVTLIS